VDDEVVVDADVAGVEGDEVDLGQVGRSVARQPSGDGPTFGLQFWALAG
jgi:hypothetical protein